MQEISTNVLLAFALVALAVIIVMVFLIRRLMGIGNTEQAFVAPAAPPAPAPVVTTQPPAPQPQPAQSPSSRLEPAPPAHSRREPTPPSRPRERSYTEISAAEAPYAPTRPTVQATAIDYSNEAASAGPSTSYTAIAIADALRRARGGAASASAASAPAPSAPAPSAPGVSTSAPAANSNGAAPARPAPSSSPSASGQSYTAIALAAVEQPSRKIAEPPRTRRIDYSGLPADIGPNASYTAIAVAAAVRAAGP